MSLGQQLLEPIRSGCSHIDWECEDAEVIVDIEVSDRLAMLVRSIYVLGRKRDAAPSLLKKQAQAVIDRLTYLDTSLQLIEWDRISNMVQMRGRPDRADPRCHSISRSSLIAVLRSRYIAAVLRKPFRFTFRMIVSYGWLMIW